MTLLDIAKSLDPDGSVSTVVELLTQSNEILYDMGWIEGNLPTGHRSTVRTGIPKAVWRRMYQGVPAVKTTRAQIEDACGAMEQRAEVDVKVANLNGNTAAFRLSEAQGIVEGINQTMATALFYGDATINPEQFNGLTARYSSLSAGSGKNIVDAGGSGSNNTSVWLVVWGPNTITGIYPKGSQAGIRHQDLGEGDAFDAAGNRFRAYMDLWNWDCGLCVRDWRYAVRIANIDVNDLVAQSGTQANTASTWLVKSMIRALAKIPSQGMGRAAFYASRTCKEMLSIGAIDKNQNALAIQAAVNQFGQVGPGSVAGQGFQIQGGQLSLLGVPIRTVDALLNTESRVT